MISRITEGMDARQVRVIRVRVLFLLLKALTDFLIGAGSTFTAAAVESKGMTLSWVVYAICIVTGIVVASKNLGDALSAALPPPVIAQPPPGLGTE